MKSVMNFLRRLFGRQYIDLKVTKQLKDSGITPLF